MREDEVVFSPAVEDGHIVGAHDEGEGVVGMFGGEGSQGVDRVVGLWEGEFAVTGLKARDVSDGHLHEAESHLFGEERTGLFEGVVGRDDQPNLLEVGVTEQILCEERVSLVDGVETTEEQAYFHRCLLLILFFYYLFEVGEGFV